MALFPDDWEQPAAPDVPYWLAWIWRAWHRLSLDRPMYGGGMGPVLPARIAWRQVVEWADYHDQDAGLLDAAVRAMDDVYLAWYAERAKAKSHG